jgi:cold shock protein
MIGTLKRYDPERGFGFIAGDDGNSVFIHSNDFKRAGIYDVEVGSRIDYEAEMAPRGLRVRTVISVESAPRNVTPRRLIDLTAAP